MQRLSVKDYIVTQIAARSPYNPSHNVAVLDLPVHADDAGVPELLAQIERQYGICIQQDSALDIQKLTVKDLIHVVIEKIKQNAAKQVDCKQIFENFVFSGRCKKLQSPYELNIDLTFRCNFRCIFCYAASGDDSGHREEMSTDTVFDIIDEFKELNGAFILFGGGEPFLREDFLEIFRYTKSKGLWTYIITNGSLITEEIAYEYAKYFNPLFDKIQVSLDGSTPAIHDKQRGLQGAFEQTVSGIKNLAATGTIRPIINTVVTQINVDDIPHILNLAIELNASTYRCLKLHKIGRGGLSLLYDTLRLSQNQSDHLYDFLTGRRDELIGVIGIANDNACVFPMSTKAIRDRFPKRPGVMPPSYACAAGTTKLAIAPDGGIVPCSYFYDFPELYVGSLRENSLKEIWQDDMRWQSYREPLTVEGKCSACPYVYACRTGCRIMSYVGCGSMGGPDNGCTYNPFDDIEAVSITKENVDGKI